MTTLVMTIDKVRALTQNILKATDTVTEGRETYLQGLVATTLHDLHVPPRKRQKTGRPVKLGPEEIKVQVAALTKVHDKFYPVVLEVCSVGLPAGKTKALELNRRSNFARTAFSVFKNWVLAGHDSRELVAEKVTKASLREGIGRKPPRPLTVKQLKKQAEKMSKELVSKLLALAEADKDAAIVEYELVMGQLTSILEQMGLEIAREAAAPQPVAPAPQPRPIVRPTGSPFPFHVRQTETAIIRQQERPA